MKKTLLTISAFILMTIGAFAQDAIISTTEINGGTQPCITAEYNLSTEILEGALKQKMIDLKLGKGESTKDGYKLYKGASLPQISETKMDVYFKISGDKQNSKITMVNSKGYGNFMKTDDDADNFAKSMAFVTNFANDANAFLLAKQIDAENDALKDNEKQLKREVKSGSSLMKSGSKIDSRISKNASSLASYKKEMEIQQKALDAIKTKTATLEGMKALQKETDKQESLLKKATKNYDKALKRQDDYKEDLQKIESKINDNKSAQESIKSKIAENMKKITELKSSLNSLKR